MRSSRANRLEEFLRRCDVPVRLRAVRVEIAISGGEDERPAELKWILPQFVLAMPFAFGACPRGRVERKKEFPEGTLPKPRGAIRGPRFVDQERERNPGFHAERGGVLATAQSERRDAGPGRLDLELMVAQPGDVLAAEHSAVMAQERDDGRA